MAATIKRIDRYRIVRLIGSGGMGEVYQAQDPNVDRLVAIKLLKESLNTDEFRERFLGEARAAAKLEHPNVVKIFDAARFRGRPFIAMEYISGSSLAQVIARAEPLLLHRKLEILEQLCAGLASAHAVGVIHRDVKPGNVMLDERGNVKIVDFGIAKSSAREATSEQIAMGTPCYMSPEQLRQRSVDHRTDMFSAAVVAYELLTYRRLFEGDAVQQVARVLSGQVPPMGAVTNAIPVTLERVIKRALATQPADRFRDMGEMQRALAAVREQIPARVLPSNGRTWNPGADTQIVDDFSGTPVEPTRSGTWLPRVGASVAVAALALGAWLLFTRPAPDTVAPAATQDAPPPAPPVARPDGRGGSSNRGRGSRDSSVRAGGKKDSAALGAGSTSSTKTQQDAAAPPVGGSADDSPSPTHVSEAPKSVPPPGDKDSSPEPSPAAPVTRGLSADDESGVRSALKEYEAAFEKLSSVYVKAIWPTINAGDAAAFDAEFLNAQSYHLEISNLRIVNVNQSRVQVNCMITKRIIPKHGDARTVRTQTSILLDKIEGHWLIDSLREPPAKR